MPKQIDFTFISFKLKHFYRHKNRLPSYAEMQDLLGYKSKGGISALVPQLVSKGWIEKDKTGKLIPTPYLQNSLKLLGTIQAGFPTPAEEDALDTLSLDDFLVKNPNASYILRVNGDSMIDEGIKPDDLVIVERGREPRNGDIVVAQVDGEWTLKYFEKKDGEVALRAANKKYPLIKPKQELTIGGVVVANIRKYK